MEKSNELKIIKKKYGEEMMHLCRYLFPSILEMPGSLINILENNISHTKKLINDIKVNNLEEEFKDFIYSFYDVEKKEVKTNKSPFELLRSVGYTLYKCNTEEEIQAFKRYYADGEALCTFNGGRLKKCCVFFAVRDDAESLNRDDFENPKREDKYGTSVISIQFSLGKMNTLSIKNRYNHSVNNPDATFSNNLENIVIGLTSAFENEYGLNIDQNDSMYSDFLTNELNYVQASNGKFYRYNYEINGIYYCENNVIIDNGRLVNEYENQKERYILMDYLILDLKNKKFIQYDYELCDSFYNIMEKYDISKIKVKNENNTKVITIKILNGEDIVIILDKSNNIIEYKNNNIEIIYNDFLHYSSKIKRIEMNRVRIIKDNFLTRCYDVKDVVLSNVESIGDYFLRYNSSLKKLSLLNLKEIGNDFLPLDFILEEINFPNVEVIGNDFLFANRDLYYLSLPNLRQVGDHFLAQNNKLKEIDLPSVQVIGNQFLCSNSVINKMNICNLKHIKQPYFIYNPTANIMVTKQINKKNNKIMKKI